MIWLSCVISFVSIALAELLFSKVVKVFAWKVIISCILSCAGALAAILANRLPWVRALLAKHLYFSPAPSVLADVINIEHPGSTARLYIKNTDYYVEGAIAGFSNDPSDPYMALVYYSFNKLDEEEPYYESRDEKDTFIINLNEVLQMEVWPTTPEEKEDLIQK